LTRLLLAAITCEKGDLEGNLAAHRAGLADAQARGCDLVVFPEFSLTGSVDPLRHPERTIGLDDHAVQSLIAATRATGVAAVFGLGERRGGEFFITQVAARHGEVVAVQRKRHLGEGEDGHATGKATAAFDVGATRAGIVICAESTVDWTWDATYAAGARTVLFCSAPGLDARPTDEPSWRAGWAWWEGAGLADARRHAERLGVWVAMATQAGSTIDEDFPGIAALIAPSGEVLDRLPDWRPGSLAVEIPA
jgi:predicted amidohydrolase